MEYVLLIISFVCLIKSADVFVDSSIDLAKILHIPEVVIGATIVTIGTTLPELLVSSLGAIKGHSDISFSNGAGSIIFNAGIIASITMLFGNNMLLKKQRDSLKTPIVLFFVACLIIIFAFIEKVAFIRTVGLSLVAIFGLYCYLMTKSEQEKIEDAAYEQNKSLPKIVGYLILSAGVLAISSNILVDNSCIIARRLGIAENIIGLTILAIGTSLPELTTAITSIKKNHNALSFGNILGANIFDITLVTGVPILIKPYLYHDKSMLIASMIMMGLFGIIVFTGKFKKLIAVLALGFYFVYIYAEFVNII